jgi:hypothetical protein
MGDWATALVGVGGTLFGVGVGGVVSALGERARWRREQRGRWVSDRRDLYTRVLFECEYIVNEVTFGKPLEGRTFGEIIGDLRPVEERLRPLVLDLELIGTDADAESARALQAAAKRFMSFALANPDATARPAWDEWSDAIAEFKRTARAGLFPE